MNPSTGKIELLRHQHHQDLSDFARSQKLTQARMTQGLKEKLNQRRSRRSRMEMHSRQMEALKELWSNYKCQMTLQYFWYDEILFQKEKKWRYQYLINLRIVELNGCKIFLHWPWMAYFEPWLKEIVHLVLWTFLPMLDQQQTSWVDWELVAIDWNENQELNLKSLNQEWILEFMLYSIHRYML